MIDDLVKKAGNISAYALQTGCREMSPRDALRLPRNLKSLWVAFGSERITLEGWKVSIVPNTQPSPVL